MEIFDVVDVNGIPTGETVERSVAHDQDIRHRTAHVWVVRCEDGKAQLLLQKRAADKESFPGCFDTSAAGHIHAGDEPLASALRELEEELGIKAEASDLSFAGIFYSHYAKPFFDKPFRDNEVTFVYVYHKPVEIANLRLQAEEVEAAEWFDLGHVEEMITPPRDASCCVPREGFGVIKKWVKENLMNEKCRNVATAGTFNTADLAWTRPPKNARIGCDMIEVTTEPHTDLWQRTYYHFRNDNAPVLQMETEEKFFSFVVKTDFSGSHHRFDQCGIVMYLDSENWLKGSVEYENEEFQHLGSVVTNHGYSDWATTEIPADVKTMWYRLSRREDDYCIECSQDGEHFVQMRVCHMWEGGGKIRFGIYACSPEDSSFTAVFTDMAITECKWLPHNGQQPD